MLKAVECIRRPSACRGGFGARARAGFTLLELVIAIGVMTAMAGVALDLLISANDKTAFRKTAERMERARTLLLEHARSTVKDRYGDVPQTNDGLLMGHYSTPGDSNSVMAWPVGANLQNFRDFASLPEDPQDDLYFDGWASPIWYIPPASSGTAAEQATAYLVSPGPDRVLVFNEAGVVLALSDDDLVFEICAVPIYDAEAQARADEINLALAKRCKDKKALLGSVGDSPLVNSYPEIYCALNGVALAAIDAIDAPGSNFPYLPNYAARYKQSPWKVTGSSYGYRPMANVYPVAQVEAIRP